MPTYGYECTSCGHAFDVFQNISDAPIKKCPQCSQKVSRLINGGMGVIFKGSGFYVTDKRGGSVPGPSKEAPKASEAPCTGCAVSESCPKAVNS